MTRLLLSTTCFSALWAGIAASDVPVVATDIAPVHSLVSRVMDGVGEPALVVQPGASPHEYSLRPSEASALEKASVVFWIGDDLTPWLADALDTLAADATVTALLEADGTTLLDFREDALFEAHDHGHEDGHDDHDDHDKHDHDEDHASHDDHDDHEGHAHGTHDPHAWLSVENAANWLNVIAAQLSAKDPGNAGTYFANAAAGREELEALKQEVSGILDPVRGGDFIVFHDAYQYFEVSFDFPASGAISISDASDPGPARIAEIQARVTDEGIDCVLSEPQYDPGLVKTVLDGTDANTGVLDPLGSDLEPGKEMYPQMIRNLATILKDCL